MFPYEIFGLFMNSVESYLSHVSSLYFYITKFFIHVQMMDHRLAVAGLLIS